MSGDRTVLWQGKPGRRVWRLGEREKSSGADMPTQHIDHVWQDAGDHTGHISDPNHARKISVHGEDCTEVATRIVNMLNEAGDE